MENIKNIIFDLGVVLLNLDKQRCIDSFVALGFNNVQSFLSEYKQKSLFHELEIGQISPAVFRNEIRRIIGEDLSDEAIDKAWNNFLQDIPIEKLNLLLQLRKRFNTFMLSNTNAIHIEKVVPEYFETNGHVLSDYFEKAYFSHELGLAKPDKAIFEYVLQDAGIRAEETLFIDDAEMNIKAAMLMGFQTYMPKPREDFSYLFRAALLKDKIS